MPVKEMRDFIFENYYKRIGFSKGNSYYQTKHFKKKHLLFLANKLIQQIPDLKNAYQPKTFRNPKSSNKLYKTIKQAEKVSSDSSLYSDKKKVKIF